MSRLLLTGVPARGAGVAAAAPGTSAGPGPFGPLQSLRVVSERLRR